MLGVAHVPLRHILENVSLGLFQSQASPATKFLYAEVHGAGGRRVGSLRYAVHLLKPIESLLRARRKQGDTGGRRPDPAAVPAADAATAAVARAQSQPNLASHLQVRAFHCSQSDLCSRLV